MYILYADESGSTGTDFDNEQQPIFVLGGFVVEDDKWHEINRLFNKKKIEINEVFRNAEIHTNEIFNSSKKSIFDSFEWRNNLNTLEKLADVISELSLEFFYVGIDKPTFKKNILKRDPENKMKILDMDPYMTAYIELQNRVSSYLNIHDNKKGLMFLDEFLSLDRKQFEATKFLPERSEDKDNIIENALFLKSHSSNFIQIADFYAFYLNKYFCIKNGYKKYSPEKTAHCLKIGEMLLSHTKKDNCHFFYEL